MEGKPVRLNLKRIGKPLDAIQVRLKKIAKRRRRDDAAYAKNVIRELKRIRKQLSDICENDRWYIDV